MLPLLFHVVGNVENSNFNADSHGQQKFGNVTPNFASHARSISAPTHLLYAALEGLLDVGVLGDLVEVSVAADEEVERQRELRVGALAHALDGRLVVELQVAVAPGPRHPHHVPLVQRHRLATPAEKKQRWPRILSLWGVVWWTCSL